MLVASRFEVRSMGVADITQVAQIERESFPTTWPQTAYRRELVNRLARYIVVVDRSRMYQAPEGTDRRHFLGFLRRRDEPDQTTDCIVGYLGLWLMVNEAHVVAIAVREAYRRQGLGELLLAEALSIALASHQENVTLEVRRTNTGAQALYEKYRFLKVGVRPRYYSDNNEDAIIMSTPPIQSDSYLDFLSRLREEYEQRWGTDAS